MKKTAIIMAGGSGKRFWPLSREKRAKQSLTLFSEKTLLAETIERVLPLVDDVLVVSARSQAEAIDPDVAACPQARVIYEPCGRNTAPCIMLALREILTKSDEDRAVVVLPADHRIAECGTFREILSKSLIFLEKHPDSIGTIGITPTHPETGFGYIKMSEALEDGIFKVASFEEKPDFETASRFLKSGGYLWNSGMFLFTLNSMLDDFKRFAEDIYQQISSVTSFKPGEIKDYDKVRSISFDYAIMEKTDRRIFVLPGSFGWSDVGSWLAFFELQEKDENNNVGIGRVSLINCKNSLVFNQTERDLVLFNRDGELIVATEDAIFAASLDDYSKMREVTEFLKSSGATHLL